MISKNKKLTCPKCGFEWQIWNKSESLKTDDAFCRECETPITIDYINYEVKERDDRYEKHKTFFSEIGDKYDFNNVMHEVQRTGRHWEQSCRPQWSICGHLDGRINSFMSLWSQDVLIGIDVSEYVEDHYEDLGYVVMYGEIGTGKIIIEYIDEYYMFIRLEFDSIEEAIRCINKRLNVAYESRFAGRGRKGIDAARCSKRRI